MKINAYCLAIAFFYVYVIKMANKGIALSQSSYSFLYLPIRLVAISLCKSGDNVAQVILKLFAEAVLDGSLFEFHFLTVAKEQYLIIKLVYLRCYKVFFVLITSIMPSSLLLFLLAKSLKFVIFALAVVKLGEGAVGNHTQHDGANQTCQHPLCRLRFRSISGTFAYQNRLFQNHTF